MKKVIGILLLFLGFSCNAFAAPLLTDEISQDYINHVHKLQAEKKLISHKSFDFENAFEVFVYSKTTVGYDFSVKYVNNRFLYEAISPKINDKMTLYIAEDVYKDDKLYIKKDTEVVGYVDTMSVEYDGRAIFTQFVLSNLFTTDVNGKVVPLQGQIERSNKTGMLLTYLIKKNKKHLLYCN